MAEPLVNYTIQGSSVEDKVYDTQDRYMEEDITILQVPMYEVSGPDGGTTLIIGED